MQANLHTPYSRKEYTGANICRFLLGGIGTGNVSVGPRGELCDWEIFNRPGKGNKLPYTFFAIWSQEAGGEPDARVLEARHFPPHERSHGYFSHEMAGLPRFDRAFLSAEYPFAQVRLEADDLPLAVTMEAFTPFVPLDVDNSSIPGAVIRYRVKNNGRKKRAVTVAGSLMNVVGLDGWSDFGDMQFSVSTINSFKENPKTAASAADPAAPGLRGIYFRSDELEADDFSYGSLALTTHASDITVKPMWYDGGWWDLAHEFWDDFSTDGLLDECSLPEKRQAKSVPGSLGICHDLEAGEEAVFEFILTWHFPNRPKYWGGHMCACADCEKPARVKNYYAGLFTDAWDSATYLSAQLEKLEAKSRQFTKALYTSTLPGSVIESLANNITILRSTTCFVLEGGTFLAWEGCFDHLGCCEGNCTHVWNYAQTVAFLFPSLEHSMRRTEFLLETQDDGSMPFRSRELLDDYKPADFQPATDGQMGCILRLFRDWKLSGDDALLRETWDNAAKALDFAFGYWDKDGDFVLESKQHNTYDIEFYGPNSLTNSLFYAALMAGEQMAAYLGDTARATQYREAHEQGRARMDGLLFDETLGYYIQVIDDVNKYKYQYGKGCLSDQLIGQTMAHLYGLGHLFPAEHVKRAAHAIFKHNFRGEFYGHHNVQRTYAINDDGGLLLCTWPDGGRPKLPFVYSDEVWPGIEYQVTTHLVYEGFIDEALTIVQALRDRHDGIKRSPWNEVECGSHYARSMASWGLLPAFSGYKFDVPKGEISFAPVINADDFSCFFSVAQAWGIYKQKKGEDGKVWRWIEVLHGSLEGVRVNGGEAVSSGL